jgi:OOP family OmpA-OmpF porin
MKLQLAIVTVFLFLCVSSFAQKIERFNKLSIEVGGGIQVPFSPSEFISRTNYINFGHAEIGLRYMFNQNLGVKLNYTNNRFRNKDNIDEGINYNKIGVDAYYNTGRLFLPHYIITKATVFTHAGLGYTRASPVNENFSEQTGNFNIGIRPQVKITNQFAAYVDGTYNMAFKQHYSYSGQLLSQEFKDQTGSFATISIGLIFYPGSNKRHSDWY